MGHCSHGIVAYQPASRIAGAAGRPEALSAHARSSAPASLPPRPGVYLIPWQWEPTFLQDAHGIIQVGGLEMVRRRGFQLRLRFQLVPASTLVCLLFGLPSRNLRLQRQTQEKQSHINCSQLPRLPKIKSLHLSFPLSHTHMHTHTQAHTHTGTRRHTCTHALHCSTWWFCFSDQNLTDQTLKITQTISCGVGSWPAPPSSKAP